MSNLATPDAAEDVQAAVCAKSLSLFRFNFFSSKTQTSHDGSQCSQSAVFPLVSVYQQSQLSRYMEDTENFSRYPGRASILS